MISVTKFCRKGRKFKRSKNANTLNLLRGNHYESIIRGYYERLRHVKVELCTKNMVYNDIVGKCDGLMDKEGMVEIKWTRNFSRNINSYILKPKIKCKRAVKRSHYMQIQIYLRMYGRLWCDYVVYSHFQRKMFICRCYRDDLNTLDKHYCLFQYVDAGDRLDTIQQINIINNTMYYPTILMDQ